MYNALINVLTATNNTKALDLLFVLDTEGMDWDNYSTTEMFATLRDAGLDTEELTLFNAATAIDSAVVLVRNAG